MLMVAVFSTSAQGQYIEQWRALDRYRYLPRLPEGPENPPPLPETETEVTGSQRVLVDEMKGLVVLDDPKAVSAGKLDVTGIQINAAGSLRLVRSPGFRRVVQPYLGGPVSVYRLNQMVRDIIIYYRNNNQPVVDVSVPEQDITDGVVQIVVTEARVGEVRVEGPCYFDPCNLVNQVCISPGDVIYETTLLRDQRWLMRNPYRDIELELTPGDERGETDIVFNVCDRHPFRAYAGYEDTGNQVTGLERTIYGFNWNNAFDLDDQMGYQFTTSSDFYTVQVHSGIYSMALANRDIISIFGAYAEVHVPPTFNPFNQDGQFWQTSLRWYRELCPWGCYEHGIQAGFDFKNTNTDLDFGGVFVAASDADIIQWMWGYNGKRFDSYGSTRFAADVFWSPGGIGNKNTDAAYQQVRPGAQSHYFYSRGYAERRTWLTNSFELVGRVTGQVASTNLLSPETLGLGGFNSVRGYDQYTFGADSGYFANIELWTEPIYDILGDDELRFLAFYDFSAGYHHTAVAGIPNKSFPTGVGTGFRYHMGENFQVRCDYGFQLRDVPEVLPQSDSRFHIGAILAY
jgi:hemolysin activation/secretion protein